MDFFFTLHAINMKNTYSVTLEVTLQPIDTSASASAIPLGTNFAARRAGRFGQKMKTSDKI